MEIKRIKETCEKSRFCQDCPLYVNGDNARFPEKEKVCLIDSTLPDNWDVDLIETLIEGNNYNGKSRGNY